jgi:xylulokinase
VPQVTDAACLGAAILAGVAAGVYPDFATAVKNTVRLKRRVKPDKRDAAAYEKRYQLYKQLYPALINVSRQL